ncbi:MAG TPA: gluconokinase [Candidatus Binatia bacterium]|nr:gluconokinase [Candidatus Binatia bacterium]
MNQVFVGIDMGTSAVKVLAVGIDGRTVAEGAEPYELETPRPEWVELDPDAVYNATMRTLQKVLDEVHLRGDVPAAIGISVAMHGVIPVDERGEALGPLITWMDRRSGAIADGWKEDGTALALYRRTGAPMHPMLPLCKLRWLSEHDAGTFKTASRFVSIKELLIYRWTGEWLVDHAIASATGLFDVRARTWDAQALDLARVGADRLSKPVSTSTTMRELRGPIVSALALRESIPVVLASSDGALANLGAGAVSRDTLALTLGTSGAIRTVAQDPIFDDAGRTFCYIFDDRRYLIGGPTSSAGAVLNWLLDLLCADFPPQRRFESAMALAEQIEPGAEGLTFLPFLSGERAPYWMSSLRGNIIGLDLAHDRRHIIRAAVEGIVFALYAVDEILRARLGTPARILLSGGLTHARIFRQMIADVFGSEAAQPNQLEASAFGAAMMAALATGALKNLEDVATLLQFSEIETPDPQRRGRYRDIYARYRAAVDAALPLFAGG